MEIYGIGTDIIEISRIRDAINRTSSFKRKVYTEKEIEYIEKKKEPYASYAGRFAAKEAVSKALGTGERGFSLSDVEILNDELGKPNVVLYNEILKHAKDLKIQIRFLLFYLKQPYYNSLLQLIFVGHKLYILLANK